MSELYLDVTDFDDAVREVLHLLYDSDGTAEGKIKAFFFRGWYGEGLGASAVLRAVAQCLKSARTDSDTRKHFDKIIHVDCSLWKNRRTMQRAIAEELNLHHLMHVFDEQDEEDDFRGVDESSRTEIVSIGRVINHSLRNERFLVIFHYGGDEDIDLTESGIPVVYCEGKLLWTNHGRFQFPRKKRKVMSSSVNIDMYFEGDEYMWKSQVRALLPKEAAEVIGYTGMDEIDPSIVVDCFLYSLFPTEQVREKSSSVDYGWATHACNYWICDGILEGNRAWEVGNALYGVIPPLGYFPEEAKYCASLLDRNIKPYQGWNSITSNKQAAQNISAVPVNVSSYFLTFEGDGEPEELANDMFQLASNLRVLKLCKCSFDFSSPPFRCCQKLRFLWLDNCTSTGKEEGEGACFPDLLVLDIRNTNYVLLPQMIELMTNLRELNTKGVSWRTLCRHFWKKLQNLQKLRLTESSDVIPLDNCSAVDMMNLELLDFSGNTHMESLPEISSAGSLKVLILDGCSSLKHVAFKRAPPLIESFSFDGYGPADNWTHPIQLPRKELRPKSRIGRIEEAKVTKISLEGCARLHSIFLRALFNLKELDLSGTDIKTIDLGAMDVPQLKKLFLLGCEQLRTLLWDGQNPRLDVLYLDTNRGMTGSGVCCGEQNSVDLEACISCTDGRFLWSLTKALDVRMSRDSKVHLHISSTVHSQVNITKSIEEIPPSQEDLVPTGPLLPYSGTIVARDLTCPSLVWDHQQLHPLGCHIEIGEGSHDLETMVMYSGSFSYMVRSMHVHDNSSVTAIPQTPADWYRLEWCHAERCPKLLALLTSGLHNFRFLRILSASDLPMAYCILGRGLRNVGYYTFGSLQHIYLHNCPRLVFVIPMSTFTLPSLETLHIAYCSKLQHVFPLVDKHSEEIASGVTFNNLKHIKLYHLHNLEQICEARLTAPALETISLRDCSALRRLPAVGSKLPMVDCEKDWWERLEWDGLEANHDTSLFQTRHSAYYKKTLPRVSVLW